MTAALSVRLNRLSAGAASPTSPGHRLGSNFIGKLNQWKGVGISQIFRTFAMRGMLVQAGSKSIMAACKDDQETVAQVQ
ncbi:hypothetical protein SDJN03_28854, partial [Cucurbita argyrosperma subsp. sororia]